MTAEPRYCYRHPDRETGLSCSECGRPICYECMTPAAVGLRCPDHSGKPQGVARVTTAARRGAFGVGAMRVNIVTLTLIGINVFVFAAELALGGNRDGTGNWIYDHGVLVKSGCCIDGQLIGVAHGDWWRLLTSPFLHYGFLHIGLNMFSLYFAGSAGALVWSPNSLTVGASGAIFGVLGGLLVLERRGHIGTGGQVLGLIVLNLIITFAYSSSISVGGHLGGLAAGILVMLGFLRFQRSPQACFAVAAVVAAASLVIAYSGV